MIDAEFTQLCSEKTLQTEKSGFFLKFAQVLSDKVGKKWIKNVFGKKKTDIEKLKCVYEDDKIRNKVIQFLSNVQEVYRPKNKDIAKKLFTEAQNNTDLKKSLNLCNQALLKSPIDSIFSSILYRRACILYSLGECSNALTDLQLCLKSKIGANLKSDVYWLLALCYYALNQPQQAMISFNLAEKLVINKPLINFLRHLKNKPMTDSEMVETSNQNESHASNKLKVTSNASMGRYVIASEPIKTGEVLVVENPQVACLLPEKFGTHCHHCFKRFLAPLGCPHCASVAFCSSKCQQTAILSYHKYECKFMDLLIGSGMSVLSLAALRYITQKSLNDNFDVYPKQSQLCTNGEKRQSDDFFQRTLMAAFLLRCLQKSHYFGENSTVVPTEDEYKIGEMILYYLQMLQFNAHEIIDTSSVGRPVNIGVAVYPTVALFNHECYPAVTRHFVGKSIVITALRPLAPGSLIAENYGPIFTRLNLNRRQRALTSRYWFQCQCRACVDNWPLLSDVSSFVKRVRCSCNNLVPTEQIQCPQCGDHVTLVKRKKELEWCEEQYQKAFDLFKRKEFDKVIELLCEALDCFHKVSAPPHRDTHLSEENLRICFAQTGNLTKKQ